jgi:hypothetical protein
LSVFGSRFVSVNESLDTLCEDAIVSIFMMWLKMKVTFALFRVSAGLCWCTVFKTGNNGLLTT